MAFIIDCQQSEKNFTNITAAIPGILASGESDDGARDCTKKSTADPCRRDFTNKRKHVMAYTTIKNLLTMTFRDIRNDERRRTVQLGGLVIVTDDDANLFNAASKSIVAKYDQSNIQGDDSLVPDADSEVRTDTLRLFFRSAGDQETIHLDVPDPHDEVFLATSGAGANILKERADLLLAGAAGVAVDGIIQKALDGDYLMSDGELAGEYLFGERVT